MPEWIREIAIGAAGAVIAGIVLLVLKWIWAGSQNWFEENKRVGTIAVVIFIGFGGSAGFVWSTWEPSHTEIVCPSAEQYALGNPDCF